MSPVTEVMDDPVTYDLVTYCCYHCHLSEAFHNIPHQQILRIQTGVVK